MSLRTLREAWRDFWFRPEPTSTLAVLRIAYGLVIVAWAASVGPDLMTFYSPDGFLSRQWTGWGLLRILNNEPAVIGVYATLVASAVALIVGYRTRLAAVVVYVALSSLFYRNPYLQSGGDKLLRITGLFLMFAPTGESLSIDRWRRGGQMWDFPRRAPWALRLIQVQVSVMYAATALLKIFGQTWREGTAVGYALQLAHYVRIPVPQSVIDSSLIMKPLSWATLLIEAAFGVLVWNRRLRPWIIASGIALHLSIELTMKVGFFSWAVLVTYIAFVPPDTMSRWLHRVRNHTFRRRSVDATLAREPTLDRTSGG